MDQDPTKTESDASQKANSLQSKVGKNQSPLTHAVTGQQTHKVSKRAQMAKRRTEVSDRYLFRKETMYEIAEALNISVTTVCFDLKACEAQWRHDAVTNIDIAKARELRKIDRLELMYLEAWERSRGDRTKRRQKAKGDKTSDGKLAVTQREDTSEVEGRDGDPRFLEGMRWCVEKRCQILGLDAPEQKHILAAVVTKKAEDMARMSLPQREAAVKNQFTELKRICEIEFGEEGKAHGGNGTNGNGTHPAGSDSPEP